MSNLFFGGSSDIALKIAKNLKNTDAVSSKKVENSYRKVFKVKNYSPFKIMALVFIIVFMFVFSKGIEVLTNTNSYKIPYDGPDKSAFEKWLPFTKGK